MLIAGRRFRPGLVSTLAAAAGIAAMIALGFWQLDRARQKLEAGERLARLAREPAIVIGARTLDPAAVEFRRMEARGRFEPGLRVLLDNRVRRGMSGYEVIMPLAIAGSTRRVLVNRGWVAGSGDRSKLPAIVTPSGDVTVSGFAVIPGKRMFELSADTVEGAVWQNLTIARYREAMKVDVEPVVLQQSSDIADGLVRDWTPPASGAGTHQSYAVQWFGFAVLIAVLYVVLNLRRDAPQP